MARLDFENFEKLLEVAKQNFICLRCGECCFAWSLHLPDGSEKLERQNCPYLIPRHKEGVQWHQATCTIHNTPQYPWECHEAVLGLGYCPLGLAIWRHLKEQASGDQLPGIVEQALKEVLYTKGPKVQ